MRSFTSAKGRIQSRKEDHSSHPKRSRASQSRTEKPLIGVQTGAKVAQKSAKSAAEMRVLGLIAEGKANKEIAITLTLREETVKAHVRSILSKLGVKDRTHAAMVGLKRGIIEF